MPNSGSRILYIDDEVGLCRLAQRQLERLGFVVSTAHSGPEGVTLAREHAFDLVALDHYMPGQNGLETLEQLMQLPQVPAIVYVTGSDETDIAVSALKAGAADYVVKSASNDFFHLLGRTINQALDARRILAEKERAEQNLRETNAQLEAMLSEMNHRVANSLQMVSSLVKLQARRAISHEARAIMHDTRQRIDAVARVHRHLYISGGGTTIGMVEYIAGLVEDLAVSFGNVAANRQIRVAADPVDMPAAEAIMLGISINELVSNACKYAYDETENGEVRVSFIALGGKNFRLVVEDDGRGYDEAAAPAGTGLGTQIIRAMADSLGATLRQVDTGHGFRSELERAPAPPC